MGDGSSKITESEARHLLRRTGFGARPRDVDHIMRASWTRAQAADWVLKFTPSKFLPRADSISDARTKWLRYMVHSRHPLQEKLVLFWHDHFSTGVTTVGNTDRMVNQNGLLRQFCKGDFKAMVKAVNKDPAMMRFLDTQTNSKLNPNENYGRELQELFTLGVEDFAGNSNYSQQDVAQIARAFTGWRYDRDNFVSLTSGEHDFKSQYPARGEKVIYTTRGQFTPSGQGRDFSRAPDGLPTDLASEGSPEIDTVINIIFAHRDTDGKNTVARHIARKLITYFAHPNPDVSFVDDAIAASSFDTTFNVEALLRVMFVDDRFFLTAGPIDVAVQKSVKWPVDFVVSTIRLLNLKTRYKELHIQGGSYRSLSYHIDQMGQTLFDPPSVFGWDWETAWLSSVTMLARSAFARDIGAARTDFAHSLRTDKLIDLALTSPAAIVDAVAGVLGVGDQTNGTARDILIDYLTDGTPNAVVNLGDTVTRLKKLNGLFALVIQSPAYQLQ